MPEPGASIETKRSRPTMLGYGISTKEEGMLSWEWVAEKLAKSRNYWICSTRPDGRPHASPVWGVWIDDTFYFGCSLQSRKARNLTANPEVVVHLESGDDVVILEGQVERKTIDEALFARIAEGYHAKYAPFKPEYDPNAVYFTLKPRIVFAWEEKSFPNTATRWVLAGK